MDIDRIIVPLDVPNFEEAIALVNAFPEVSFWKVGLQLFVAEGPKVLAYLREHQKRIFLDLKFHDIPNTVAQACRSAAQYQVDFLTLHGAAGREALTMALAAIANEPHPPQLLAISLLTSINSHTLALDLKVPIELPEYTLTMALMAKDSGLTGAVCSPQEAEQIKQVCGKDFLLVCPGVRPSWAAKNDQQRTMTPSQAFQAGADYLVIGRPLTQASDRPQAWAQLKAEIMG
ncbi:MAG: orotidine-5'-phosphate decarboxylase [Synechococcaceae cyanobacterium RL_1_2]|nr:orotidine-5'-phosphate decarboxylase [Synechococcaceae cyanobacterium RL_1_2]